MVSIGSLSWTVQVKNAAKAKEEARDVEESVKGAKEGMEEADEATGGLKEKLGDLTNIQEKAGEGFDSLNAKSGFFGTALSFVSRSVSSLVGALGSVSGILLGGGLIAALVALATAFKHNIGNIQGKTDELIADLGSLTGSVIKGFNNAMKGLGGALSIIIGIIGDVVGWVAKMNEQFQFVEPVIQAVVTAIGAFAIAKVIVAIIASVVSILISLIGVAGGVLSAFATLISGVGTLISIMGTIVSVIGTVIATLNPLSLAILAIVAVIVGLYAAWKTNFLGIRDITDDVIQGATELLDGFISKVKEVIASIRDLLSQDLGSGIAEGFRAAYNGIVPDSINIPSVTLSAPSWAGGMEATIGGGEINIPQLQTGGIIERGGMAQLHAGETVIPADVSRDMGLTTPGSGGDMRKVEIDIGGIRIGDQSINLKNMNRQELRRLAQIIADQMGNEVRNQIT